MNRPVHTARSAVAIVRRLLLAVAVVFVLIPARAQAFEGPQLAVDPAAVNLSGPEAAFSLLVDGADAGGEPIDLTRTARYRSRDPEIAQVTSSGVVHGRSDGETVVDVTANGQTVSVPVSVSGATDPREIHFGNDVVPILSKFGCNSGGCHGKAEGQNGFKLSVFGFDPEADYRAITAEGRGRRVFLPSPEQSLLLQKACGDVPHGGGVRIRRNSYAYRLLRDWVAAGTPDGDPDAPKVVSLELTPHVRTMSPAAEQQLRAVATYSDGRRVDVTPHAKYQSNNEALATVDENGLVTAGDRPGEVALMAAYMGAVDVFRVMIPQPKTFDVFPQRPVVNFVDELVDAKLRQLNIAPSEMCSDEEFLRRVSLDVIGTLPSADEARAFLADARPDKRALLVERLLERPEYADYWALKWSDLLRVDREKLGRKGAYNYYRWIRDSLGRNVPFDEFAREVLTAEGAVRDAPAAYLHKVVKEPGEAAATISQVFLGVRIECARCHHHPFDRWSQSDYYGMQAHFAQVGFKSTSEGEMIAAMKDGKTTHPRTGQPVVAHPLGTSPESVSQEGDRRRQLAEWMTAPGNPWFARCVTNRYWAHFLGRGIVEPVDDFRSTNPPTNPELLGALAEHFVTDGYDLKQLIRTITASRTYQLSSHPNGSNRHDEQNYSRALFRPLDAEVLLDAVCTATGVPEKFDGVPSGARAIQLWDSQVPHYFLKLFGRPIRATPCECERSAEPGVSQVLHVLNAPSIQDKLSHAGGTITRLVEDHAEDGALAEELYLTFYSRFPTKEERSTAVRYLQRHADNRRAAAEDLAWSMLNTVEFLFNH